MRFNLDDGVIYIYIYICVYIYIKGCEELAYECDQAANLDVCRMLLDAGASPNHRNEDGMTALFLAALSRSSGSIEVMIRRGGDPDLFSKYGHSARSLILIPFLINENSRLTADENKSIKLVQDAIEAVSPLALAGEGANELTQAVTMAGTFQFIADFVNHNLGTGAHKDGSAGGFIEAYKQNVKMVQLFAQLAGISTGIECSYPKRSVPQWLNKCATCDVADAVKSCSACKVVRYCSSECQKKGWKRGHKKLCKWLVQTNAAEGVLACHKAAHGGDTAAPLHAEAAADEEARGAVADGGSGDGGGGGGSGDGGSINSSLLFDSNIYLALHTYFDNLMPATIKKIYTHEEAKQLTELQRAVLVCGTMVAGSAGWADYTTTNAVEKLLHNDVGQNKKPAFLVSEQVIPRRAGGTDQNLFNLATQRLKEMFSQSVPNAAALAALAEVGPLLEMGCGTGYWAMLLREDRGVDILAYDLDPPTANGHNIHHPHVWTEVVHGGVEVLADGAHADRALLLSWPTNDASDTWDVECLDAFAGSIVCYVGTFNVGPLATALDFKTTCSTDDFQTKLQGEFDLIKTVALPVWPLVDDNLTIWKRK